MRHALVALLLTTAAGSPTLAASGPTPATLQAAVEALFAADRGFSAAAAEVDMVTGLAAMLDADAVMPLPPTGSFARGKAAVVEALRASPSAAGRTQWTPVGGGLSGDGRHGYTFGFATTRLPDGSERPAKYMSYWVRRADGWRVAVFKRFGRPASGAPSTSLPPLAPAQLVAPADSPATLAAHRESLMAAERGFSDEAQAIGLGPAFAKHGSPAAVNMGGGPGFTVGAENIAREVGAGDRKVVWSADDALVAASGDLGVTWGRIRPVGAAPAGAPSAFPFFTIWRRESPTAPWRYVAE